jgi:hypothetical protein
MNICINTMFQSTNFRTDSVACNMSEFELTAESNPLLENDEDAEVYAQQARRVKNAKAAKRRSFALIIIFGLGAVISLFLTLPLFRHHTPKGGLGRPGQALRSPGPLANP